MRFAPVSEEEAARLWPKGEYDALVTLAVEKQSKKGNDMFELSLTVYDGEKETKLKDWLMPDFPAKLQAFCKSGGFWDEYMAGELSAHLITEANVRVKLGVQEGDDEYPPRNKVVGYVKRKTAIEKAAESKAAPQGVPPKQQRQPTRQDPTKPPTPDEIPF
jgi:hypothetical protein